jgi:hypothetical protein
VGDIPRGEAAYEGRVESNPYSPRTLVPVLQCLQSGDHKAPEQGSSGLRLVPNQSGTNPCIWVVALVPVDARDAFIS